MNPFTQRDPIGLGGGLNQYGYAGGDPINNSDPFGLCLPGVQLGLCMRVAAAVLGRLSPEQQFVVANPRSALIAKGLADEAGAETISAAQAGIIPGGVTGLHNGPADAVRHASWSCKMTRKLGAETAAEVGNAHEAGENNPPAEKAMDQANNASGRAIASREGGCTELSVQELKAGNLQTGLSP